jgi:hypothetical protein
MESDLLKTMLSNLLSFLILAQFLSVKFCSVNSVFIHRFFTIWQTNIFTVCWVTDIIHGFFKNYQVVVETFSHKRCADWQLSGRVQARWNGIIPRNAIDLFLQIINKLSVISKFKGRRHTYNICYDICQSTFKHACLSCIICEQWFLVLYSFFWKTTPSVGKWHAFKAFCWYVHSGHNFHNISMSCAKWKSLRSIIKTLLMIVNHILWAKSVYICLDCSMGVSQSSYNPPTIYSWVSY